MEQTGGNKMFRYIIGEYTITPRHIASDEQFFNTLTEQTSKYLLIDDFPGYEDIFLKVTNLTSSDVFGIGLHGCSSELISIIPLSRNLILIGGGFSVHIIDLQQGEQTAQFLFDREWFYWATAVNEHILLITNLSVKVLAFNGKVVSDYSMKYEIASFFIQDKHLIVSLDDHSIWKATFDELTT